MQFFQKLFTRHQKNSNRLVQLKKKKKNEFCFKACAGTFVRHRMFPRDILISP